MSKAIELADYCDGLALEIDHTHFTGELTDAAAELRRLAAVEQEFKLSEEMNEQLREQNTLVDAACAKMEQELADLKAAMSEPVADLIISDDDFTLGLTDVYAMGTKRLENGTYDLYAMPKNKLKDSK